MSFPSVHCEWARGAPWAAKARILVFAGRGREPFLEAHLWPGRQTFVMEAFLFFFLSKQGVVINKELFANVGRASPTLFLILQCVCADAFLM